MKKDILTVGFILVCCIMPALLLYFLNPSLVWNKNAIETTCNITGHRVENGTCSIPCFSGYIVIAYTTLTNKSYSESILIDYNKINIYYVENDLNSNYPPNKKINCFYNKNNPADVELELFDISKSFHFFWFVVLCSMGVLSTLILVGIILGRNCCSEYQKLDHS